MNKQVICINWGRKYGAPYVNRLFAMVSRNITPPFTFTCFTDDDTGFHEDIRALPLPPLDIKMPTNTLGIWQKARLWSEKLGDLSGPVLFLDLDLVVTDSLDAFFSFGEPDDVILARNPSNPLEKLGQTSVYRFPVGKLLPLKKTFMADPQGIADQYRFEQRFVTRNAPGQVKFWPRQRVAHFRRQCMWPTPLNYFLPPRLPKNTSIVIFAGHLNPPDAIAGRYRASEPTRGAMEHLRAAFGKKRAGSFWAHIRHYLRPTPWIEKHWRE